MLFRYFICIHATLLLFCRAILLLLFVYTTALLFVHLLFVHTTVESASIMQLAHHHQVVKTDLLFPVPTLLAALPRPKQP